MTESPTLLCEKQLCTGCEACHNACPLQCIHMTEDKEGFLSPEIDQVRCVQCGLCRNACPIIAKPELSREVSPRVFACWHKDDNVRRQSSSGGVFSVFAESVLAQDGMVFGAAYDLNMHVRHTHTNNKFHLDDLRRSKYVQSEIGLAFQNVRTAVEAETPVLFVGTPCQVAGLYKYLVKDYPNLITCDLVCHGVPSPKVFAKYITWIENRLCSKVLNLNFRDKAKGWENSRTVATIGMSSEHPLYGINNCYYNGFINALYLRECCYNCSFRGIPRCADITLGDFWGIGNQTPFTLDTEKKGGISLILVNSALGLALFEICHRDIQVFEREINEAIDGNSPLCVSPKRPSNRSCFFADFGVETWDVLAKRYLQLSYRSKLRMLAREWLSGGVLSILRALYNKIRR